MPLSSASCPSSSSATAAAGPVPSDSQLSKQTIARDNFCNQSVAADRSPVPRDSESPELDSPGLDMPGRLCIHLDSTEGLKSPSPPSS